VTTRRSAEGSADTSASAQTLRSSGTSLDLSIIIVSYNTRPELVRCLEALRRAPPRAPHEIIVVDNRSSDGSPDAAAAAGVRVIDAGGNAGFAKANNVGIRVSTGAVLLLLNSDAVVPKGALDGMLAILGRRPEVAAVGPRLVDDEGRAELSFGRMIGPLTEWRQKRLVTGHARRDPAISARVEAMTRREQIVDWVSGACLLVRRSDAEDVGLLDERFFMYTEDVDFCASLRARGRTVLFTPEVEIVHSRGRSAAVDPAATAAAYMRSRLAFYDKHHPLWAPVLRLYLRLHGNRS
jgi:N-acetylglucosaminyl-diphospho-decaprenol L-rhamnosyltransferase